MEVGGFAQRSNFLFYFFGKLLSAYLRALENNLLVGIKNDNEIGMSTGSLDNVKKINGRKSEKRTWVYATNFGLKIRAIIISVQ